MESRNTDYIYKNDLDEACFQHDMTYGRYKGFTKRTKSDNVLREKAFKITINLKYDGYQREIALMVNRFFDKKSKANGTKSVSNQQLADKLYKQIIRKFKRRIVYFLFKNNI